MGCDARTALCWSIAAFQSTHPRGVRRRFRREIILIDNFNPRTHVGCDEASVRDKYGISIFQSTHPRGVRPIALTGDTKEYKFQSTHPRGVRPRSRRSRGRDSHFNPRTHVGCDGTLPPQDWRSPISIHAPTWGATKVVRGYYRDFVFQSTHPRGVRLSCWLSNSSFRYFNPRTHVGCDIAKTTNLTINSDFNPRTHVGCDSEKLAV